MSSLNSQVQSLLNELRPGAINFEKDAQDLAGSQERKLLAYINANKSTQFGLDFEFHKITSYSDFKKQVPLHSYEELEPYIQQSSRQENILTAESILRFESTSGSSSHRKFIPYTKSFLSEYEQAIAVWLTDLSRYRPKALQKKYYASISPPLKERENFGNYAVGDASDLAYLSDKAANALGANLIIPESANTAEKFYQNTMAALLSEELSFMSLWSPSFFLLLDQYLGDERTWDDIFPNLSLLSCWADASSASLLPAVQQRLGNVEIQGKGLWSTEGVMSVPLCEADAPVLSLAHFYEFEAVDSKEIYLAHQLSIGHSYSVILTTASGLYRYRTNDVVEIISTYSGLPTMRFSGRQGIHSDLVGEKLSEYQVTEVLQLISYPSFLYAVSHNAYILYSEEKLTTVTQKAIVETLRKNPYYAQADDLKQLLPLSFEVLPKGRVAAVNRHWNFERQIKDGDQKAKSLFCRGELDNELL